LASFVLAALLSALRIIKRTFFDNRGNTILNIKWEIDVSQDKVGEMGKIGFCPIAIFFRTGRDAGN
jgi:hypothetical protein